MVGDEINPSPDTAPRAVRISPVGWTTGVWLKNPSFCKVSVPIFIPVDVSVIRLWADKVWSADQVLVAFNNGMAAPDVPVL